MLFFKFVLLLSVLLSAEFPLLFVLFPVVLFPVVLFSGEASWAGGSRLKLKAKNCCGGS